MDVLWDTLAFARAISSRTPAEGSFREGPDAQPDLVCFAADLGPTGGEAGRGERSVFVSGTEAFCFWGFFSGTELLAAGGCSCSWLEGGTSLEGEGCCVFSEISSLST